MMQNAQALVHPIDMEVQFDTPLEERDEIAIDNETGEVVEDQAEEDAEATG